LLALVKWRSNPLATKKTLPDSERSGTGTKVVHVACRTARSRRVKYQPNYSERTSQTRLNEGEKSGDVSQCDATHLRKNSWCHLMTELSGKTEQASLA
jgi:hypothetical protein